MQYLSVFKFLQLALYFIVASQGAFYLTGFYKVLMNVPDRDFILLRKTADPVLAPRYKLLYIAGFLVSIVVIILQYYYQQPGTDIFMILAFLLFTGDMLMASRISGPLNKTISAMQEPFVNAGTLRLQWLRQIYVRAFLSVSSFALLFASLHFKC